MKALRDMLVIARRELEERVKSKWFLAMTVLGPVFMVALIVVPSLIASQSSKGAKVEIIDRSGVLGAPIEKALDARAWRAKLVPPDTTDAIELARIRDDEINGFLVIPADAVEGGEVIYRGDNASSQSVAVTLNQVVREAIQVERFARAELTSKQLDLLRQPVNVATRLSTGEADGSSGMGAFFMAYILAFVLYMVITLYGVAVMRSVVQEKTSRVMELMVAAVKPRSLMGGKILGVGAAGLLQVAVWLTIGALALAYRESLLGLFGISGGGAALPTLAGAEVALTLVFFVLGFFFYAAMYAAVGAMVSSEQETQQVQMPVTMLLVIGVVCFQMISNDPRGTAAEVMTQVPFWSPLLMPMRYVLGGAGLGQVALSLGILVVSTVLMTRAAAKIYRVGVLLYGKRPSVREVVRWLRY